MFNFAQMVTGRRTVASSLIDTIAETQKMLDACSVDGIRSDFEVIRVHASAAASNVSTQLLLEAWTLRAPRTLPPR